MQTRRPEIFVSATSGDLRTCRQLIKEALLTLGCVPIEQTNFAPDARTVRQMLRARIIACDAVLHVAGEFYGAEPYERDPGEDRRSYTQLEYEIARELKKPVYVFICGDGFPYDPHEAEDEARRGLQQQHRMRLQSGDHLYTPVASRDDLALRIHALQMRVEDLGKQLQQSRSWMGRGVTVGLIVAALLGVGIMLLMRSQSVTTAKVATLQTELDQQRDYIKSVAEAYTQLQAQANPARLSDAERFDLAITQVAQHEGMNAADLKSEINLFVAAINTNLKADFYDHALAAFAQQNFTEAAGSAGQAADEARTQRLAAEQLAAQAQQKATGARDQERDARTLEGRSLFAAHDYAGAVKAFQQALDPDLTSRQTQAADWANLNVLLGDSLNGWAGVSLGDDIAQRRKDALQAYADAMGVYTREADPKNWARTQDSLGNALEDQAGSSSGSARYGLLQQSIAAFNAALDVRTQKDLPQDWAQTQNDLGNALRNQAESSSGIERSDLLNQAVASFRSALQVYTEKDFPQDWATTQNRLGLALWDQAGNASGSRQSDLLNQAVAAFQAALQVRTQKDFPRYWARTQNNLAMALWDQAQNSSATEQKDLLKQSIAAYQNALQILTQKDFPQEWELAQNNLGFALEDQAGLSSGDDRNNLLKQAVAAYQAVLQVTMQKDLPQEWARTQGHLGTALWVEAENSAGTERNDLLRQAVAAYQAALQVYTQKDFPQDWAGTQTNLGLALVDQAESVSGAEKADLLKQAVAAGNAALEVFTPDAYPAQNKKIHAAIDQINAEVK